MICEAVAVPVIADADTGYDNALNLMRTVHEMEAVGVAGIHVEDQVTPKRCGHYEGKEVVDRREFVKNRGCLCSTARCGFCDHCPYGRSGGLGLEEAIIRGQACREAGALEAPQTVDEIKRVADAIDAPLLITMVTQGGKPPYVPADELERLGYDIILFASDMQRAAIFGMRRLLHELREKRTGEFFPDTVGFQEHEGIINSDYYFQLQECYLHLD